MKAKVPTEDSLDRLAKAIMVKHLVNYEAALRLLSTFRINLICNESIFASVALQAALLTAVNSAKRAFHGGVFVSMPRGVPCLLPWPTNESVNVIVHRLGARLTARAGCKVSHTLYFGYAIGEEVEDSFRVVCSGWRGGIVPAGQSLDLVGTIDFALGGVAAGALGVARAFLQVSGLSTRCLERSQGISLWRPDLEWASAAAEGPTLEALPKNIWMLGLGHLGQAFLWNFGLLPYAEPREARFLLQDFDRVVRGNFSSGMLCEAGTVERPKTRVCAEWLEARGFRTSIVERAFDSNTKRSGDEPFVACCGFDSADPRRLLESAGFDLVVECALGSDTARFDRIILHTFPDASRKAEEIWRSVPQPTVDQNLLTAFKTEGDCGVVAESLARKPVASAFIGALAGSLVVGEILRALHGGVRCELVQLQVRENELPGVVTNTEKYVQRIARCGFIGVREMQKLAA